MDELLKALQNNDSKTVRKLADQLFITRAGTYNRAQINEFERYAPCKIVCGREAMFHVDPAVIIYNDRKFAFSYIYVS